MDKILSDVFEFLKSEFLHLSKTQNKNPKVDSIFRLLFEFSKYLGYSHSKLYEVYLEYYTSSFYRDKKDKGRMMLDYIFEHAGGVDCSNIFLNNYIYFFPILKHKFLKNVSSTMDYKGQTLSSMNMSIVKSGDDGYFLVKRFTNIQSKGLHTNCTFNAPNGVIVTKVKGFLLDKNFNKLKEMEYEINQDTSLRILGLEDVRLLRDSKGDIHYSGQILNNSVMEVSVGTMDPTQTEIKLRPLSSPFHRGVEKNWVMFETGGEIKLVYQWNPLTIMDYDGKIKSVRHSHTFLSEVRGSSNGIHFNDEIWFVCHISFNKGYIFYDLFVVMDPETNDIKRFSVPFRFVDRNEAVQYCTGFIHDEEKDGFILTYSINDIQSYISVVDREEIENLEWISIR